MSSSDERTSTVKYLRLKDPVFLFLDKEDVRIGVHFNTSLLPERYRLESRKQLFYPYGSRVL